MLNTFHRISLSCKVYLYFNCYFIVGLRTSQRVNPNLWLRLPWLLQMQSISFSGTVEWFKSAATSRSLGYRGYLRA